MKLSGTQTLQATRERVFQSLIDPQILARCIPGCERLEQTAANTYSATIKASVGSIKGVFTGSVRVEDVRQPDHFRMVVEGKGQPGFLKGSGDLDLEAQDQTTVVKYVGEIQVGGTIAGVGQRMIEASAKMMATQFFAALQDEAKNVAP